MSSIIGMVAEPIETENYSYHNHEDPHFITELQDKRERNESATVAYPYLNILES